jgi:hypothetical protein
MPVEQFTFEQLNEEWRPVVGWAGSYAVSNLGRIRREAPGQGTFIGRIRRLWTDDAGYWVVTFKTLNRKLVRVSVHRVVAAAFIGECPPGKEVNHKDGIKANNRATNLEYVTPKENIHHAMRLGLRTSRRR